MRMNTDDPKNYFCRVKIDSVLHPPFKKGFTGFGYLHGYFYLHVPSIQ